MFPALLAAAVPSLISGAFNLFGAKKASEATGTANMMNLMQMEKNFALQKEALALQAAGQQFSMDEAVKNREQNLAINANNVALQREFAQHGIQWRVQDAIAAGVHPMAALGGSGATYSPAAHISGSPISQVTSPNPSSASFSADTSMATALGNMGQDVSRAMSAAMSSAERTEVAGTASSILNLENQKLQNELLKSQIARLRGAAQPATPMPVDQRYLMDGQGQTAVGKKSDKGGGLVQDKAMERVPGAPHNKGVEPGSITDLGYARTSGGDYYPVPGKDIKERIEDNWFHETMHFLRNNIAPAYPGSRYFKPPPGGKQGYRWGFTPFHGYYQTPTRFQQRFTGKLY
ncbi:DNA pilot protein [Apis mellifera associated microvirus 44]|nr:DNA pilot protein [Apis mellifera associated microvirus 44]